MLRLSDQADRQVFETLLAEADVVVCGYRPGALAALGLSPDDLAAARPGLVVATVDAWGSSGPWSTRRGFDSLVQAATGIAMAESPDGVRPGVLPAQALDHSAGYLLAGAVLSAVRQQLDVGGTWRVQVSLARLARWLLDQPRVAAPAAPGGDVDFSRCLAERKTASGVVRYALPAMLIDGGPSDYGEVGRAWGKDVPEWSVDV